MADIEQFLLKCKISKKENKSKVESPTQKGLMKQTENAFFNFTVSTASDEIQERKRIFTPAVIEQELKNKTISNIKEQPKIECVNSQKDMKQAEVKLIPATSRSKVTFAIPTPREKVIISVPDNKDKEKSEGCVAKSEGCVAKSEGCVAKSEECVAKSEGCVAKSNEVSCVAKLLNMSVQENEIQKGKIWSSGMVDNEEKNMQEDFGQVMEYLIGKVNPQQRSRLGKYLTKMPMDNMEQLRGMYYMFQYRCMNEQIASKFRTMNYLLFVDQQGGYLVNRDYFMSQLQNHQNARSIGFPQQFDIIPICGIFKQIQFFDFAIFDCKLMTLQNSPALYLQLIDLLQYESMPCYQLLYIYRYYFLMEMSKHMIGVALNHKFFKHETCIVHSFVSQLFTIKDLPNVNNQVQDEMKKITSKQYEKRSGVPLGIIMIDGKNLYYTSVPKSDEIAQISQKLMLNQNTNDNISRLEDSVYYNISLLQGTTLISMVENSFDQYMYQSNGQRMIFSPKTKHTSHTSTAYLRLSMIQ